jgi:hypothetical protein
MIIEEFLDTLDTLDRYPEREAEKEEKIITDYNDNNNTLIIGNSNSINLDNDSTHTKISPNSQYLSGDVSNLSNLSGDSSITSLFFCDDY